MLYFSLVIVQTLDEWFKQALIHMFNVWAVTWLCLLRTFIRKVGFFFKKQQIQKSNIIYVVSSIFQHQTTQRTYLAFFPRLKLDCANYSLDFRTTSTWCLLVRRAHSCLLRTRANSDAVNRIPLLSLLFLNPYDKNNNKIRTSLYITVY